MIPIDLSLLEREPEAEYHAKAGQYLSSHLLADFRKSPYLYDKRVRGCITEKTLAAFVTGRAAHVRILEGQAEYHRRFAIGGPINKQTNKPFGADTKAFREWAEKEGKPGIHYEDAELIENLAEGVSMNSQAIEFLSDGVAEGVVRAEYCSLPCQSRLDWVHSRYGIMDLKTTDNVDYFQPDGRRYGYAYQMAFYRAMLAQVLGGTLVPVYLIAVEKKEPYRCGVWRMCPDVLAQAQKENEAAIGRLKACRKKGLWPTGYEEIRVFDSL